MTTNTEPDELACPTCKPREHLVIVGLDVAALLGRYHSDDTNAEKWAVKCFECHGRFRINDETRDALFGSDWRTA